MLKKNKIRYDKIINKITNIVRNPKFIVLLVILFLSSLFYKRATFFILFTLVSAIIDYVINVLHPPVDFGPIFFGSIIITKTLGIGYAVLYVIFAGIIPTLMAGGRIETSTLVFLSLMFAVNYSALFIAIPNIVFLGVVLSIVLSICAFFLNNYFGVPITNNIFNSSVNMIVNIIYFLYFGRFIYMLLQ